MKTKRNGEIELLRFIFCLLVVLFHCNKNLFGVIDAENYIYALSPRGYIGVEFFFMLSGYFMAASIEKSKSSAKIGSETVRFVWKKYFSIFWFHIIAYTGLFFVQTYLYKDFSVDKLLNAVPDALLITRTGVRFLDINGVEWYLSAMLLIMAAVYPVAKRFFEVYAKAIAPISAVFIYGFLIQNFQTLSGTTIWTAVGYRCMWRAAAGINVGMFMYCCVKALKNTAWSKTQINLAKIARGIMFACIIVYSMCCNPKKYEIYAVIVLFIAILLCFVFPYENVRWLDSKAVMYLGRLSLPLYLCQNIAITIGKEKFRSLNDVLLVVLIVAMDFAFSIILLPVGARITKEFNQSKLNKAVLGIE